MDQALTNKKFIEQIDDVIETLGGTPVDLELTEDREDDMVSNGVFVDKMDEVIQALGGTPSEIIVGDDKADDMVSDNIFQLKMEDVVKNMSGGGGGGGGDLPFKTANVTLITSDRFVELDIQPDVYYHYQAMFYAPNYDSDTETVLMGFANLATASDTLQQSESIMIYVGDRITLTPYGERVSESGDVTYDAEAQTFTVFGDCTITLHSID